MKKELNERVLQELNAMVNRDGLLKPETVVRRAKNRTSPLHGFFTWDDKKAGAKWRLEEARQLIREVELQYDEAWLKGPVPAFVSLSSDRGRDGGGYRPTPQVLSNVQLRAELLATAKKELAGWARRHKVLRGFVLLVMDAGGIPPDGVMSEQEVLAARAELHSDVEAA